MNLTSQKKVASKILKCGVNRVKVTQTKEVEEAITREDIRNLIKKDIIRKIQKKGKVRPGVKKNFIQKKRGRRSSTGSRKGRMNAKNPRKQVWMKKIKALRKLLRELRDSNQVEKKVYSKIYMQMKGGMFRNKKHLLYYLKEHELLKKIKK